MTRLRVLTRLNQALSSSLDLDDVLTQIARAAADLLDAPVVEFWIPDVGAGLMRFRVCSDPEAGREKTVRTLAFGEGGVGLVAQHRRMLNIPDVAADGRIRVPEWFTARRLTSGLWLPITRDEELLGVLTILGRRPFVLDADEVDLIDSFVAQAAAAIRNATLYRESELRRHAAEALAETGRLLSQALDPREVGCRITEIVSRLLGGRSTAIFQIDPLTGNLATRAITGSTGRFRDAIVLPPGVGVAWLAVRERATVVTPDLLSDPRVILTDELCQGVAETGYHAVLAVPLIDQGTVIGALTMGDDLGRVFTDEDVRLAETLAVHAALALKNATLFEEAERRARSFEALARLTRLITSATKTHDVFQSVTESACELLDAKLVRLWLTPPDREELALETSYGRDGIAESAVAPIQRVKFGEGLIGQVVQSGAPEFVLDVREDARFLHREWARRWDLAAFAGIPLVFGDKVVGLLSVYMGEARKFRRDEKDLMKLFAAQAAIAIEQNRLYHSTQAAYEQLSLTQQQLLQSQKIEAIGRLAGGVAHDFNNILTIITGRSAFLQRELPNDDRLMRHVDVIRKAADRAAGLTRQLLAFSRKQVLQPTALNLSLVLADMGTMLRRLIREDIDMTIISPPGLPRVRADRSQVEQMLMNLVVNARDAMPRGGTVTVETRHVVLDDAFVARNPGARSGHHIALTVTDTGVGMDADTLSQIFEPFFTTKDVGQGTGLGLATVYGIVQQHEGYITVDSGPGRGTTFAIYLPCTTLAAEDAEPVGSPPRSAGTETILLVEDEPELRSLTMEVLSTSGYTVLEAGDPAEALAVSQRHPGQIDLLLTDVVMPQMSGRALAKRLLTIRPKMKLLYMSGYTADAIAHHGVLDPGVVLLQKPFRPEALVEHVHSLLNPT